VSVTWMSAILDTCVDGEVGFAARDGLDVHPGVDKYVHDVFHVLLLSHKVSPRRPRDQPR